MDGTEKMRSRESQTLPTGGVGHPYEVTLDHVLRYPPPERELRPLIRIKTRSLPRTALVDLRAIVAEHGAPIAVESRGLAVIGVVTWHGSRVLDALPIVEEARICVREHLRSGPTSHGRAVLQQYHEIILEAYEPRDLYIPRSSRTVLAEIGRALGASTSDLAGLAVVAALATASEELVHPEVIEACRREMQQVSTAIAKGLRLGLTGSGR